MPWYDSDNDLIELVCILDRSGSMSALQDEAINGFNEFIEEQRKVSGDALVTLVLFDNEYDVVYEGKEIGDVEPLTDKTFIPRGSTALLDAIGKTVARVKERLFAMEEEDQPGKVLFCIITDGQENQSIEFKKDAVSKLIDQCKDDYTWEFAFLSADMDAVGDAHSYGVKSGMTAGYDYSAGGMKKAFLATCSAVTSYRSACKSDIKAGLTDNLLATAMENVEDDDSDD